MTDDHTNFASNARYHRQMLLPGIGADGQARISAARVLVMGCGALGCALIDHLARAGIGSLVLVDRDIVELTNLQRQMLYTEADVGSATPKAHAAAAAVARINRNVECTPHATDFRAANAQALASGCDVIVDGLDSFETRYLLNDLSVHTGTPYIYGGAVGTSGMSLPLLPAEADGPCLRCLFDEPPAAGTTATCDTAGVLGPVIAMVAARQAAETIKLLAAGPEAVDRRLTTVDVWSGRHHAADVTGARRADCPTCGQRDFAWLEGRRGVTAAKLCGRGAVQIDGGGGTGGRTEGRTGGKTGGQTGNETSDGTATEAAAAAAAVGGTAGTSTLADIAARLAAHGDFVENEWLVRGRLRDVRSRRGEPIDLTIFADGRTLVHGTDDPVEARAIHARYVGH
ncbi:MAG: ThiF family adenylyltransferase [Phycisphaerales bacterium]